MVKIASSAMEAFHAVGLQSRSLEQSLPRAWAVMEAVCESIIASHHPPEGWRVDLRATEETFVTARVWIDRPRSAYVVEFTVGLLVWAHVQAVTTVVAVSTDFEAAPQDLPPALPLSWMDNRDALQRSLDAADTALPDGHSGFWECLLQHFMVSVLSHELAHVVRGHLHHLDQVPNGRRELDELKLRWRWDEGEGSDTLAQTIRRLEFDADGYASKILAVHAISPPAGLDRWSICTPQENAVLALLGQVLFLVALERSELEDGRRVATYPQPLLRIILIGSMMAIEWAKRCQGDFWEDVFLRTMEIAAKLETAAPDLDLLRGLLDPQIRTAIGAETTAILDEVERWEEMIVETAFPGPGFDPEDGTA